MLVQSWTFWSVFLVYLSSFAPRPPELITILSTEINTSRLANNFSIAERLGCFQCFIIMTCIILSISNKKRSTYNWSDVPGSILIGINSFNLHKNPGREVLLWSPIWEMRTSGHREGKSFAFDPTASAQGSWLWNLLFLPIPLCNQRMDERGVCKGINQMWAVIPFLSYFFGCCCC